jgi:hypothetical protein
MNQREIEKEIKESEHGYNTDLVTVNEKELKHDDCEECNRIKDLLMLHYYNTNYRK